jgi:hypothetical protein
MLHTTAIVATSDLKVLRLLLGGSILFLGRKQLGVSGLIGDTSSFVEFSQRKFIDFHLDAPGKLSMKQYLDE